MYNFHFNLVQVIGLMAMVVMVGAYAMKTDRKLNQVFIVSNSLWVLHFMLLGGMSGAVNCVINVLRSAAAVQFSNRRWRVPTFFIVATLYCVVTWVTYKTPTDLMPLLASLLTCIGFYLVKPGIQSRFFILLSCFAWLAYATLHYSIGGMIAFSFSVLMTLFVMHRLKTKSA